MVCPVAEGKEGDFRATLSQEMSSLWADMRWKEQGLGSQEKKQRRRYLTSECVHGEQV